jgi:hypothetical protein
MQKNGHCDVFWTLAQYILNIATPLTFAPTDIQCLLFLASIFFESVASLQFMLIKVKLLLFIWEKNYFYDCLLKTFRSELVVFVFCVNSFKLLLKSLQHYSITGTPPIGRFLGPRKNRLNRNPSYYRSFNLWYKLVNREFKKSKVPFFAHFHEFSTYKMKKKLGLYCYCYLSQI